MIPFFPTVYPDELVYSWFSRYYTRTGYISYASVAADLFTTSIVKPNIEFLNHLTPAAIQVITQSMSLEQLVMNHTMFPYYARFLPENRLKTALKLMVEMDTNYYNTLFIRKLKKAHKRFLRYCPLCVESDRDIYGETYWHRVHQIDEISICPIHGCKLLDSTVEITSKGSPSLTSAEEVISPCSDTITDGNILEQRVAQYVSEVFFSEIHTENITPINQFLQSKLEYTRYVSPRGKKRNMSLFYDDFTSCYARLSNNPLQEQWQIGKVLGGRKLHTYEICLIAMFLEISPKELVRRPPFIAKPQYILFDDQITQLHRQGLNDRQIANRLGGSYDFIKLKGEQLHK